MYRHFSIALPHSCTDILMADTNNQTRVLFLFLFYSSLLFFGWLCLLLSLSLRNDVFLNLVL